MIKKIFNFYLDVKKFIMYEIKQRNNIPFLKRIRYYKRGFLSSNMIVYNLKFNNHNDYVSDWVRFSKLSRINRGFDTIINDKIIFHNYFKNNPNVVQPLAYIYNNQIIDFENHNKIDVEDFVKKLKEDIILKPSRGGGGGGVVKLTVKDMSYDILVKQIKNLLSTNVNYVIQEVIKQEGFCHSVNPCSVNTIRILTIQDPVTKKPFIAKAVQRFGTKESNYLDNWSAGGISVDIDIDKGIYKKGATFPKDAKIKWLSLHPDTGVKFENLKIENWTEAKRLVLNLSEELFYLRYIGWDVIPHGDKFYILEANSNSDVNLLQIHGGLLKNNEVKKFYQVNGVIN